MNMIARIPAPVETAAPGPVAQIDEALDEIQGQIKRIAALTCYELVQGIEPIVTDLMEFIEENPQHAGRILPHAQILRRLVRPGRG